MPKVLEPVYYFSYKTESSANYLSYNRYCLRVEGKIWVNEEPGTSNGGGDQEKRIGVISGFKLLISTAIQDGINPIYVFDCHQLTIDVASELYNSEMSNFKKTILDYYNHNIQGKDLLLLDNIYLEGPYRGKRIGRRAIKDFHNNYISGCGLYVTRVFPLQVDSNEIFGGPDTESHYINSISPDFRKTKSEENLKYFKSIGFEHLPGVDNNILVINSMALTSKYSDIQLT